MEKTLIILKKARNFITKASLYIKIKLGWLRAPKIIPHIGFSNGTNTFITGEVLENIGISKPVEGQSKWQNAKIMLKRYFIQEFAGVRVEVQFLGQHKTVTTNKFGVFTCAFMHNLSEVPEGLWQKVTFVLPEKIHSRQKPEQFQGEIMVINREPQFGVISDIDDTILVSYATTKIMKFRLMFFNNALTRMPFEGVSAFYHALQHGSGKGSFNPLFYLSNSEWNLFDLLFEFMEYNRIPRGPLFLREMEISLLRFWKMREYNKNHKMEKLRQLFTFFGNMKFILIGDSGQRDPEVYTQISREFPGRVLAIYIRDIGLARKTIRIQTISEAMNKESGIEMILVKDTEAAARHAIKKGFILADEFPSIVREKQKDTEKSSVFAS
jgi:phosphatidate phosphatase APP1